MPELPDVQIYKQRLDDAGLHRRICSVGIHADGMLDGVSGGTLRRRLKGHALAVTRRHGKHLFAHIDGEGRWLHLHFGMTGELRCYENGRAPDHVRLRLDFPDDRHLAYRNVRKLGRIGLVDDPERYIAREGLGPDALDARMTLAYFRKLLAGRTGTIKGALMDQTFIAGLGNVYVDEMLFQTALHPKSPVHALGDADVKRLHRTMRHVLKTAVQKNADPARMPRTWLLPHRKDGASCPRCEGSIRTMKVSGRTSYVCGKHQRKL